MVAITMSENSKDIKRDHRFGYKGLFCNYSINDILKSIPFIVSCCISIFCLIFYFFHSKTISDKLPDIIEQILTIELSLEAVFFTGYAIFIGLSDIHIITFKIPGTNTTLFQKINAIFAFSLLLSFLSIILSLAFIVILNTELSNLLVGIIPNMLIFYINSFVVWFYSLTTIWSIMIVPSVIMNVFAFGQFRHGMHLMEIKMKKYDDNANRSDF